MPKRRDLWKLAAGANMFALFAQTQGKLPNAVTDEKGAKLTHDPFGDTRIFFQGPTEQLKSMTAGSLRLKPGMEPHPPHQHPEEEFMLVTEGTGEITVEGKVTKVSAGSMMFCAANHLHGIKNTGTTPMLFYFYKWKA